MKSNLIPLTLILLKWYILMRFIVIFYKKLKCVRCMNNFLARSQGTNERMGHIDFYANNAGLQPGCDVCTEFQPVAKLDRNSLREGQILPDCSHKRAFKYMIEALEKPECKFLGIPCANHKRFSEVCV